MIKGEKIRFDIHNVLYSIYKLNKNLNSVSVKRIVNKNKKEDIALFNNVTLNAMRFHIHCLKIINKYINKKLRDHEKILLISAITQIVFLDFKDYAVINCSVEIAKKLKIYHGLINASLKNISKDKKKLKKIEIEYSSLPAWFKSETHSLSIREKNYFIKKFNEEPSLHLVFKNGKSLNAFEEELVKTSEISGFLKKKRDIKSIKSFVKGNWWVQDFSSFLPLYVLQIKNKNKNILDTCAAPGGKSFQLLSRKLKVDLNDKSIERIKTLKSNLKRLNFKTRILNMDFTKLSESKNYDFIIMDAPCSAIGTIRKNPEIIFRKIGPDLKGLINLQEKMLKKAANVLNKNGYILYMVCSFLRNETENQINKFLKENNNFENYGFSLSYKNFKHMELVKGKYLNTLPTTIKSYNIDGYFAALIKKIK